jgi:hypothetical protein
MQQTQDISLNAMLFLQRNIWLISVKFNWI